MTTEIQYFNSQEAAKILGVNVSTIKRWTEEGKLECIKTPGGHRKFLSEHLTKFMELHKRKKARASILPIEGGEDIRLTAKIFSEDLEDLRDAIFEKALVGAIERVLFVLSGFIALPKPLHEIYDHLITPVLYRLGDLWESEEITIVEEHLVSQTLRLALDRLQGLLAIPREKIGTALCLNFSNELHDIPLQMVGHILEKRGYRVLFAGQMTPYLGIENVLQRVHVDRIYISSTVVVDPVSTGKEFQQICRLAQEYGIQVYVGGRGFDHLDYSHPAVVARLSSFQEVAEV